MKHISKRVLDIKPGDSVLFAGDHQPFVVTQVIKPKGFDIVAKIEGYRLTCIHNNVIVEVEE